MMNWRDYVDAYERGDEVDITPYLTEPMEEHLAHLSHQEPEDQDHDHDDDDDWYDDPIPASGTAAFNDANDMMEFLEHLGVDMDKANELMSDVKNRDRSVIKVTEFDTSDFGDMNDEDRQWAQELAKLSTAASKSTEELDFFSKTSVIEWSSLIIKGDDAGEPVMKRLDHTFDAREYSNFSARTPEELQDGWLMVTQNFLRSLVDADEVDMARYIADNAISFGISAANAVEVKALKVKVYAELDAKRMHITEQGIMKEIVPTTAREYHQRTRQGAGPEELSGFSVVIGVGSFKEISVNGESIEFDGYGPVSAGMILGDTDLLR